MSVQTDLKDSNNSSDPIGIRGYDFVEFYVGSAKMAAYWYAKVLGLTISAYLGPETGVRDTVSYYLTSDKFKLVVTGPAQPENFELYGFLQKHGDGVKRWAVEVDDVTAAFNHATANGAVMVRRPEKLVDDHGFVEEAAIRLYPEYLPNYRRLSDVLVELSRPEDAILVLQA